MKLSDIRNVNLGQSTAQKPPPLGGGGEVGILPAAPVSKGQSQGGPQGGSKKETPKQGQPANQSTEASS